MPTSGPQAEDPTEDGWYRTGDLLSRDTDGLLTFHGRLREAIRRRGETIAPAEIEAVALKHPDVREAAAIGVPADDGVEDEILLCVVMRANSETTPAAVHAFLSRQLPRFMVPALHPDRAHAPQDRHDTRTAARAPRRWTRRRMGRETTEVTQWLSPSSAASSSPAWAPSRRSATARPESWDSIRAGRGGIARITHFDARACCRCRSPVR